MRTAPLFFLLGAALVNCASLTPYDQGTCGNHVVDADTEDCDTSQKPCIACRLHCEDVACPAGWGCGADKICRQLTGKLLNATAAVSTNVVTLLSGDFDADGRTDVVGSPPFGSAGGSRVLYFDQNAGLATTTTLDVSIPIPIVKNLDHDQGDDIGFAVRGLSVGAFGALAGQTNHSFATIVFPSVTFPATDARLTVITASPRITLPDANPSCAVGLVTQAAGSSLRNICGGVQELAGDPGFKTTDVIGQPRTGLISPLKSACGQLVFATAGSIRIVSPCTPAPLPRWRQDPDVQVVSYEGTLLEDPYVGPVGALDTDEVLIHTDKGSYRLVGGAFVGAGIGVNLINELPLASGDLDGDGAVDFVYPTGIVLTTNGPFDQSDGGSKDPLVYRIVPPRDQLRWTAARIGRFNNDELPDVLVAFNESLDVDVMGNAGGGRFTAFTVRSEQIVRGISSGDFDGDRIDDVAFLQSANAPGTGGDTTLTLAFGSAVGGPEAPRVAGKFKNPTTFGSLRQTSGADSIAVVQVAPAIAGLPTTSISVLFGNGGRQQVAPLFMNDPNNSALWQPGSFSVGAFPAANTQAILSIATGVTVNGGGAGPSFATAAWLAPPDPAAVGGLDPFSRVADLDTIVALDQDKYVAGARVSRLITAVGDVDVPKNGTDELVSMARLAKAPNAVGVFVVHTQGQDGVLVATIDDARVDEGDPIELVDLDRDGFLDLVYIVRISGRQRLSVLRGDGAGSFVPTPITLDDTEPKKEEAVSFAKLDIGAKTKIALVTDGTLSLIELADGKLVAEDRTSTLGPKPSGITAIVGGDFDGDGVPDLAIAQAGGVRIIRQKPRVQ